MEHKEAAEILIKMLDKHRLSEKEKAAVATAVGILAWTSLSKSRIKAMKAKRDKNLEWQ